MTLRTPRRRISPQTKRRYKAIKGFFRRALGSPSQPDLLQITSSIAVNVTDINHKIVGQEQQLNDGSEQYCDNKFHENSSTQSKSRVSSELRNEISQRDIPSGTQLKRVKTTVINKTSENPSKKSDRSDYAPRSDNDTTKVKSNNKMNDLFDERILKTKKKKSKIDYRANEFKVDENFRKHKTKSMYEDFVSMYSTSSFHSLDQLKKLIHSIPDKSGYCEEKRNRTKAQNDHRKDKMYRERLKKLNPENYDYHLEEGAEKHTNSKTPKRDSKELDQDFIADIIRRQYKPVKMFNRKQSDLSQFSAPVCRDRDFYLNPNYYVPEEPQPSACICRGRHYIRYAHHSDCSDMRSVCDARLYNVKRNARTKHRRKYADYYNDSEIYDLVPVKEKTSPKSKRKFFEDNAPSVYYKEVPPSPRSHRPRLNLKAQYVESDYTMDFVRNCKRFSPKKATRHQIFEENDYPPVNPNKIRTPKRAMRHQVTEENEENDSSIIYPNKIASPKRAMRRHLVTEENEEKYYSSGNPNKIVSPRRTIRHQENDDIEENYDPPERWKMGKHNLINHGNQANMQRQFYAMSSLYPAFETEEHTAETTLNKTQETVSSDKTDKALCEIKDILQNFLLEIKKEASSHSAKSEVGTKMTENCKNSSNDVNTVPNNGLNFNKYNPAQCPVVPTPYMPTIPTFGNTCCYPMMPICPMNCMQNSYAVPSTSFICNNCDKSNELNNNKNNKNDTKNDAFQCETDELIKEIYKFVSRSPTVCRKNGNSIRGGSNTKTPTDAKVLTSRSVGGSTRVCRNDAKVGTPRMNCVSKSCEAIGKKMLSEVYTSDTNASYSDTVLEKLSLEPTATQSTSETEFSTELSEAKKNRFTKVMKSLGLCKKNKKDVIEEISESESTIDVEVKKPPFHQDVTNYAMYGQEYYRPPPISPRYHSEYPQEYRPPYNPEVLCRDPRMQQSVSHGSPHPPYRPGERPTAPPYSQSYESYNQMQAQVPLCLKEVEVKSIGCQSERKMSFFRKITQKVQQPADVMFKDDVQRNGSTQTAQNSQNKPGLFNWKNPQTKLMDNQINPLAYSYKTQKKLAEGDKKMRNAMLKKMLYKRNPFSPRNLIIRTLLGKDKSSFGEPPTMYRPRMFL